MGLSESFQRRHKSPEALYARPHLNSIAVSGITRCEMTDDEYIKIDTFQKTTVHGVYASVTIRHDWELFHMLFQRVQ